MGQGCYALRIIVRFYNVRRKFQHVHYYNSPTEALAAILQKLVHKIETIHRVH